MKHHLSSPISLRIDGVEHQVASEVQAAVEQMEKRYRATRGRNSGHQSSPRVVYDFPHHGGEQVMIAYNRTKLAIHMRAVGRTGRRMSEVLRPEDWVTVSASAVDRYGSLAPRLKGQHVHGQGVLLVTPRLEGFSEVLDAYLGLEPMSSAAQCD